MDVVRVVHNVPVASCVYPQVWVFWDPVLRHVAVVNTTVQRPLSTGDQGRRGPHRVAWRVCVVPCPVVKDWRWISAGVAKVCNPFERSIKAVGEVDAASKPKRVPFVCILNKPHKHTHIMAGRKVEAVRLEDRDAMACKPTNTPALAAHCEIHQG